MIPTVKSFSVIKLFLNSRNNKMHHFLLAPGSWYPPYNLCFCLYHYSKTRTEREFFGTIGLVKKRINSHAYFPTPKIQKICCIFLYFCCLWAENGSAIIQYFNKAISEQYLEASFGLPVAFVFWAQNSTIWKQSQSLMPQTASNTTWTTRSSLLGVSLTC